MFLVGAFLRKEERIKINERKKKEGEKKEKVGDLRVVAISWLVGAKKAI